VTDKATTPVELLRQMIRIRRFEEACAEEYTKGNIRGFLHLYIGEEAVATGVMQALQPADSVFATYREHGHALIRGMSARSIMAEMFGKLEGCSRGRGGSMHLYDKELNFYGGCAIVAGSLPVAVGRAYADKMQGRNQVTACFFGEGAMAEGEFHEAMNLASLWQTPVLFVCENNGYAMGTALERSESQTDLCAKAASYNVKAVSVDGMDVEAVVERAGQVVREIRELGKPIFLEAKTYRFRAHSMFDPELYRDKEEVKQWQERDPIKVFSQKLIDRGLIESSGIEELYAAAENEVSDAIAFAESGTLEPVEDLMKFVMAEEGV
jgi:pyruvate dehydrogenase E1 component alpha subunit